MFYGSGMLDWNDKDLDDLYTTEWKDVNPLQRSSIFKPERKSLNFLRHDYIYGLIRYTINTYITLSTSYLFGIDDQSGLLSLILDIEPFQAFTINITATYPFGWEMIDYKYYRGEFGSTNVGYYQNYKFGVKIKF